METEGQWCDNASCPDCGKIGADNIKMHSYAERRFRCTTCQRTFSADKGTLASIMAPATPFCCWTTQKHLTVERTMS
jgi:transposase-like protein